MGKYFYNELDSLKSELVKMTSIVEEMAEVFIRNIDILNKKELLEGIEYDQKVDNLELEIEERCISIIALYQPVAKDLRRTATVLKMITDIERMGDYFADIFEIMLKIDEKIDAEVKLRLQHLGRLIKDMIHKSMDSFLAENVEIAEKTAIKDDEIDRLYRELYEDLLEQMIEISVLNHRTIDYLLIGRYLERIADHNTNICERVIYMVEGKKVKY